MDERNVTVIRETSRMVADLARDILKGNYGDTAVHSAECLLIVSAAMRMEVSGDTSCPIFHLLQSLYNGMEKIPHKKPKPLVKRPYTKSERWFKSRGIPYQEGVTHVGSS